MNIKTKPLKIPTIVGLIGVSSTCSMALYLGYRIKQFQHSDETDKSIFFPIWLNFNYFKSLQHHYYIENLRYLDQDVDLETMKKRIQFKVMNLIVNFKLLSLGEFKVIENNIDFKFTINNPTISGIAIDLHKGELKQPIKVLTTDSVVTDVPTDPIDDINDDDIIQREPVNNSIPSPPITTKNPITTTNKDQELHINYRWIIKLINFNYLFKLNQPNLNLHHDINYTFTGEFGIFNLEKLGKIKFDGVIDDDIKFTNITVEIEHDRVYKII